MLQTLVFLMCIKLNITYSNFIYSLTTFQCLVLVEPILFWKKKKKNSNNFNNNNKAYPYVNTYDNSYI